MSTAFDQYLALYRANAERMYATLGAKILLRDVGTQRLVETFPKHGFKNMDEVERWLEDGSWQTPLQQEHR